MRKWAFVSQKGGSGKSTLCTNLSVVAEQVGETCCIIDVDPQANALLWHERRGTNQPMVIEATYDKLADVVAAAGTIGVTLVLIDTPGKIDAGALAAIKLADTIVCPTSATCSRSAPFRTPCACWRRREAELRGGRDQQRRSERG